MKRLKLGEFFFFSLMPLVSLTTCIVHHYQDQTSHTVSVQDGSNDTNTKPSDAPSNDALLPYHLNRPKAPFEEGSPAVEDSQRAYFIQPGNHLPFEHQHNHQNTQDVLTWPHGDGLNGETSFNALDALEINTPLPLYNGSNFDIGGNHDWNSLQSATNLPYHYPNYQNSYADPSSLSLTSPPSTSNSQLLSPSPTSSPTCHHPQCHGKIFGRRTDLIRHNETKHSGSKPRYDCTITGCHNNRNKGYSRPDKLQEHCWKHHSDLGFGKRQRCK